MLTLDETGANTTILVEQLQDNFVKVNTIQATLLLLGIYEDTGSLTYTRTTSRDIRAAAYLLDQHANLVIVNEFLNQPLSKNQQTIYEDLVQNAESHTIHGYSILICKADARDLEEELSSIAHKLMDALDPDVLIMITRIKGGVQLIGRSTTDGVDVSTLAKLLGGGGHTRASAALVKDSSVEDIYETVLRVLQVNIEPQLTIREIMSSRPRVINSDAPAEKIADLMQKYGYEGFPVVEEGKIVGLITRRLVDRALSHDLNLPAKSLMDAGNITIHPDATIDELQQLMTSSGWGQIPVVDQDSKIVGIVTRTDLINTFPQNRSSQKHLNLTQRLENAIPSVQLELLREIAELSHEKHFATFIVGGFVRDLLLNYQSLDFDIVVEGDAIQLALSIQDKFGGRITTHRRFGTAKWFLHKIKDQVVDILKSRNTIKNQEGNHLISIDLPDELDFISARTEFYTHPTALPTVERGSIKLDLHRRDFTINTLAMRLDGDHFGEMYDYWGGYNDLTQGIVKILHSLSFVDDPTRILRAIRYEQRYQFNLEDRTETLLTEALPLLNRVSGDRIRHEFNRIFLEDEPWKMMSRFNELNVFPEIHSKLYWDSWYEDQLKKVSELPSPIWEKHPKLKPQDYILYASYMVWLLLNPEDESKKIYKRLKFPKPLKTSIQSGQSLYNASSMLIEMQPSEFTIFVQNYPAHVLDVVYITTSEQELREKIKEYAVKWWEIQPFTDGHDLIEMGIEPGPIYQEILTELRKAWLDGRVSTQEQEEELLKQLIRQLDN